VIRNKINDIKNAIKMINNYLVNLEFYELEDIQRFGILHLLQIIGEAANLVSGNLKSSHEDIKWPEKFHSEILLCISIWMLNGK
jgi:uncharacterized protein with HEPN domain